MDVVRIQHVDAADAVPAALVSSVKAHTRTIEVLMYTPPGFSTITPYFFVKNAESFVNFLVEAFGAAEVLRSLRDDGRDAPRVPRRLFGLSHAAIATA